VQRAPGFPCALSVFCEGGEFAKPGRIAPRQCGRMSSRCLTVESEARPVVENPSINTGHQTPVIACDKREAFAQGSTCDEAIRGAACCPMDCFAEPVIGRAFARPVGSQ
jgi:hypothetical protein